MKPRPRKPPLPLLYRRGMPNVSEFMRLSSAQVDLRSLTHNHQQGVNWIQQNYRIEHTGRHPRWNSKKPNHPTILLPLQRNQQKIMNIMQNCAFLLWLNWQINIYLTFKSLSFLSHCASNNEEGYDLPWKSSFTRFTLRDRNKSLSVHYLASVNNVWVLNKFMRWNLDLLLL